MNEAADSALLEISEPECRALLEVIDWMNHGHSDIWMQCMPSAEGLTELEKRLQALLRRSIFPVHEVYTQRLIFDLVLLLDWGIREELVETEDQMDHLCSLSNKVHLLHAQMISGTESLP